MSSTTVALTKTRCCRFCEQLRDDVKNRRRDAKYVDESLNWIGSCGECYERDCEYYAELWSDFYNGCM